MSEQVLPETGDVIAAKYRVERLLGAGGMGSVYEVTHQVTGKRFAIKWLLPDLSRNSDVVQRFIREAQVAGRFEHPNVVEVYDVGQEGGSFYMVMELLTGESLADRLARCHRFSAGDACRLLVPCMRGVSRAHQAGIVHRDLKPDNIFLCSATTEQAEHPKVLDFGISKMTELQGEVAASITKTGMVMGTPHYMAPEQLRGRGMDHRVDVYAFGVILYQLLSGELPFPGDTYSELVLKIATETPQPLGALVPGISPALVAIVERAMARAPDDRFASVEEFAQALEQLGGARPAAVAATQPALATPGGTQRLETPLATESQPFEVPRHLRGGVGRPLVWLLGAVAVAVAGLAALALDLLDTGDADRADAPEVPPMAAGAGTSEPTEPAARDALEDAPTQAQPAASPTTVRVGGPEPERASDQRDPLDQPSGASADAVARPAGFKRPNAAAKDRARAEERRRKAREAARERAERRAERARTQRAAATGGARQRDPQTETPRATPATTPEAEAEPKPPGRLRVRLGPEDF